MPALDTPEHPLEVILERAFAALIDAGEVDLDRDLRQQAFEVQADEWTLRLEGWPLALAFVALDEEPASLAEREAALDAALDSQHMAALRETNRALGNDLAAALHDSGDALSSALAAVLHDPLAGSGVHTLDAMDDA